MGLLLAWEGWGRGGDGRVVDENVKLAASEFGNLVVAGLDALFVGDVQGEGGHAEGSHLGENGRIAGRRNDVHAWQGISNLRLEGS